MDIPNHLGSYVINYLLPRTSEIVVGRLGVFKFQKGFYFYCGSAKGSGGLNGRIARHLHPAEKQFWHIDYFKSKAEAQRIWFSTSSAINECELVRLLQHGSSMKHPVPGFGASDCVNKCHSHLLFLSEEKSLEDIFLDLISRTSGIINEMIIR